MTGPFWRRVQTIGVRLKIMGMVLGLILLFGAGSSLMNYLTLSGNITEELQNRGLAIASDTAARSADLILTRNAYGVHELLQETAANHQDVRYMFITDAAGKVEAHTFLGGFPSDLLKGTRTPNALPRVEAFASEEGVIWEASVPIASGHLGSLQVGMSTSRLRETLGRQVQQQLLVTGVMAALGLACALALTWLLTRPILDLVEVTEAVRGGDLSRRAPPASPDEVGRLVSTVNRMVDSLAQSRAELAVKEQMQLELLNKVMTAQEDERRRIARELHDETGQSLTSLLVGLRLLEQVADQPDEVGRRAAELRSMVSDALEEVRRLARELRPSALDDVGLLAALQRHVNDYSRAVGIPVDLQIVGDQSRRLPARVETAVYRIVQEALANVARHSGADIVSVVVEVRPGWLSVIVEDNGSGFDPGAVRENPDGRGLGLFGMQERAVLLGGAFTVQTGVGEGTAVFVKIPLEEVVPDEASAGG